MVYKALIAKADRLDIDRTDRLASKAEKYGIKAIRLLAQSTRFGMEQKQQGKRWSRTCPGSLRKRQWIDRSTSSGIGQWLNLNVVTTPEADTNRSQIW